MAEKTVPNFISEDKTRIIWDKFNPGEDEKAGLVPLLRKSHPRIYTHDWNEIKAKVNTDAHTKRWYDEIIATAERLVDAPLTEYKVNIRNNINESSTYFKYDVIPVAAAYCLTGDVRYKNRVYAELENVGNWYYWGTNAYLCTAHILFAFALCYDWLYNDFTAEERANIVGWVREKGMHEAVLGYADYGSEAHTRWWAHGYNNWNNVCNGSNIVAAIAFADEMPDVADYICKQAGEGLVYSFGELSADGSYAEPLGYWGYAMTHQTKAMAALQTALIDGAKLPEVLNFRNVTGLDNTCDFPIYYNSTAGAFNYGDGVTELIYGPCMFWLADYYNKPQYTWYAAEFMDDCGWKGDARAKNATLALLWYKPIQATDGASLPLDKFYTSTRQYGANGISMRSAWTKDALVVLAHAGDGTAAHGHLDAGGFILDWAGERWIHLYGREPGGTVAGSVYSWPLYHRRDEVGARFTYYHTRGEANNTLIANPKQDMPDLYYQYYAQLTASSSSENEAMGEIDMTSTNHDFESAKRTFTLAEGRSIVRICDEVTAKMPSTFYWFANTRAEVEIAEDKKSAMLTIGDKKMLVRIANGPASAGFELVPTRPLPTSPDPEIQVKINEHKLRICVSDVTTLNLQVEFVPQA